ncbi:MAG: hypothetical protein IJL36_01575 [Clostridia bacterium]|nr:hypothetical protein [Clostridia bacterium]
MKTDMSKRIPQLIRLVFYALAPLLLLVFLARPVRNAVLASDPAAWMILLAVLAAVCLNWAVYAVIRRKRPSFLVFSVGIFWILVTAVIQYTGLPGGHPLMPTLAIVIAVLALVILLLLERWFTFRPSKPAHATAVVIRVFLGIIVTGMVFQVLVDIENGLITVDTWILIGIIIALIVAFFAHRIRVSARRSATRRRESALVSGKVVQIIGETHLDLDGDPVTEYLARVEYTIEDVPYEAHADIDLKTIRKYGKDAFVGRAVPVYYNPADPAEAFVNKLDKRMLPKQRWKILRLLKERFFPARSAA